ncbi:MAG: hypothetical protein E3J35_01055 [Methanomassiliicoccales archaeon]|nr:MAG: hypothetical protein E3J35_01055 [Methanomassiliicoccales archaeon]
MNNGSEKYVLKANYDYETFTEASVDDGPDGDPDGDDVENSVELTWETSPTNADSDGDGLIDGNSKVKSRSSWEFKIWEAQGIPYKRLSGYSVEFLGESEYSTDPLDPDSDGDGTTDGQEVYGYNVMITWYEGDDLKSKNKTIYGHPKVNYTEPDGVTLLDIDEDGITDVDEMDPVNSSTPSILDYVAIYGDNQSMMDSQFNPFIRENSPPVILNVKIKKHEDWGLCFALFVPYPCLKRAWTDVNVEAIDVAQFTVTIKLNDDSRRSVTLTGKGHEWFQAKLDLDVWDVLVRYKVTVSMVDFAGNKLDPAYTEEVDGFFGGVLRFLEALWDFLVSLASMIADAVMAALSFIIDIILTVVQVIVHAVLEPIIQAVSDWVNGVVSAIEIAFEELPKLAQKGSAEALKVILDAIYGGNFFNFLLALMIGLSVAGSVLTVLSMGMVGVAATLSEKLITYVMAAIVGILTGSLVLAVMAIVGTFFSSVPESDPFWSESRGLSLLALTKAGLSHYTKTRFDRATGDVRGLARAIIGMLVGFAALGLSQVSPEWALALSAFGLFLAVWGLVETSRKSIRDYNPLDPFKNTEEIFAGICVGSAFASFGKNAYDYFH